MRRLIIVRHGRYRTDGSLSLFGRESIRELVCRLESLVDEGPILVLSSSAKRAYESANILAEALEADFESSDVLWSEQYRPARPDTVLSMILSRADDYETVIVVTHLEYVQTLPTHFSKRVLACELRLDHLRRGGACVIDCERRAIDLY